MECFSRRKKLIFAIVCRDLMRHDEIFRETYFSKDQCVFARDSKQCGNSVKVNRRFHQAMYVRLVESIYHDRWFELMPHTRRTFDFDQRNEMKVQMECHHCSGLSNRWEEWSTHDIHSYQTVRSNEHRLQRTDKFHRLTTNASMTRTNPM